MRSRNTHRASRLSTQSGIGSTGKTSKPSAGSVDQPDTENQHRHKSSQNTLHSASLVGSFFFLKGIGNCSCMGGLIPTLAYQISTCLPMSGHDGQHCHPQESQRQLHNDFHILGKATSMQTHVELLWSRLNDELSTGRIECDVWGVEVVVLDRPGCSGCVLVSTVQAQ